MKWKPLVIIHSSSGHTFPLASFEQSVQFIRDMGEWVDIIFASIPIRLPVEIGHILKLGGHIFPPGVRKGLVEDGNLVHADGT